jgi:hypothetical protein
MTEEQARAIVDTLTYEQKLMLYGFLRELEAKRE